MAFEKKKICDQFSFFQMPLPFTKERRTKKVESRQGSQRRKLWALTKPKEIKIKWYTFAPNYYKTAQQKPCWFLPTVFISLFVFFKKKLVREENTRHLDE